jgi:hypothetical protein
MIRCTISVAAIVLAAVQAPAQDAKTLRVYFVGNSVTDTINYWALAEVIQDTVWKVVSTTELAGVKPPVNAIVPPPSRQLPGGGVR